ncbi:MAG: glycoside hydrolase family 9 protein [Kiritimatiellaeota bacterium]|nr:glycoside hydrolase family 9 protein [Kiritimatiellota bacterium]
MKKLFLAAVFAAIVSVSAMAAPTSVGAELFPNGDMSKLNADNWPVGWTSNQGAWWANAARIIRGSPNTLRLTGGNAQVPLTIPLKADCEALKLKLKLGGADVVRGKEDWQDARVMVSFQNAAGEQVGGWQEVIHFTGTVALGDREIDYRVPAGAKKIQIIFGNLGTGGTMDIQNISLKVTAVKAAAAADNESAPASKLIAANILDKDHIMLHYRDGDVVFDERALPEAPIYETHGDASKKINKLVSYGEPLDVDDAVVADAWKIVSADDADYGASGLSPVAVHRKSKLGCMAQMGWVGNDYQYDWAYEHTLFLKLPKPLKEGKTYAVRVPSGIDGAKENPKIKFDIFNNRSEAVRVNITGYSSAPSIKSADLYMWMGDGGARDYTAFVGNKVFIYDTKTKQSKQVGTVSFWKPAAGETRHNHQMLRSAVWNADFTGFNTPGSYRLAIEGVGCSDDFTIAPNAYFEAFKTAVRGFFYMRIGEDNLNIVPVPRRPLYIPNKSPADCKVLITTMQPWHPEWPKNSGDPYDKLAGFWDKYCKPGRPENPNAYGGHSDALDWDRTIGHVSIIYDMLLPYIITGGALNEDNLNITESGNGIPDIIDEARNEVDFFLRLRDPETGGYSHGLNNPDKNVFYQSGETPIAAWANAANAAMLADAFRVAKKQDLATTYAKAAIEAYDYACALPDMMLNEKQGVGEIHMTGKDFRITAAAYLYNVTGDTRFENDLQKFTACKSPTATVYNPDAFCELYAYAAYLFTNRKVNYPELRDNMRASIIAEAKTKEANYTQTRPSRRSTDNDIGWFTCVLGTQRTILAHAVSDKNGADKKFFENALVLEADYSLGRNPLNMILMTAATTGFANKRHTENAYTSGWNDGTPGVHPGHTPYMGVNDWGGLIMGNPSWMTKKNYPPADKWPLGEMYYNTRYVYAANEFTPQQTMRGKLALYAYLHALENQRK